LKHLQNQHQICTHHHLSCLYDCLPGSLPGPVQLPPVSTTGHTLSLLHLTLNLAQRSQQGALLVQQQSCVGRVLLPVLANPIKLLLLLPVKGQHLSCFSNHPIAITPVCCCGIACSINTSPAAAPASSAAPTLLIPCAGPSRPVTITAAV
jgi:hypothetical protein